MPNIVEKDFGIRNVSRVQTNSFACRTWQEDKQEWVDSWLARPKAENVKFPQSGTMKVYEDGHLLLTYKIIES